MRKELLNFYQSIVDFIVPEEKIIVLESDDFSYLPDDNYITVTNKPTLMSNVNSMYLIFKELGGDDRVMNTPVGIMSVLHEIGHVVTYDEELLEQYLEDVEVLNEMLNSEKTMEEYNILLDEYRHLALEVAADQFAVEYVMNNYERTVEWSNTLLQLFELEK